MKDTELSKIIGMPISTIQDFKKKDEGNWRLFVYRLLSSMTTEEMKDRINAMGLGDTK